MRRSLLVLGAAALLGAGALHLSLTAASPGKDETLGAAPTRVSLTYSAKVNVKLSAIAVLAADSTEVAALAVNAGPKASIIPGDLPRRLPPGRSGHRAPSAGRVPAA